jgi:hypothetical protein
MKKPKTVAELLVVSDVCIEASEARTQLLEYRGKGPQGRRMIRMSTPLTREKDEVVQCWHVIRTRRPPRYGAV